MKNYLKKMCFTLLKLTVRGSINVEKFAESGCLKFVTEIVLDLTGPVEARKNGLNVLCKAITID